MLELQRMPFEEANACVKNRNRTSSQHTSNEDFRVPQKSIPSIPEGSNKQDMGHMLADDTMSIASVAPTLADSIGQLDLSDATSAVLPQVTGAKGRDTEDVKQIAAFVKIPVPLISARILEGSLASKSQLTLLLEKDRAKCGT